jgi:hypothetical protein
MDLAKPPSADFRKSLSEGFARMIGAHSPVETYFLPAPQRGVITEMIEGKTPQGETMHTRAARVYDENHLVQVHVIVLSADPQEVRKWDKATEKVIGSLKFLPPGGGAGGAGGAATQPSK